MKMMEDEESYFQSSDEEQDDTDEELEAAFARGDFKETGLVKLQKDEKAAVKNVVINNIPMLGFKLQQIKMGKKYGWVEKLDITNDLAPLAPEIALQMDAHKTKREREINVLNHGQKKKKKGAQPTMSLEEDPVHNDFVREMTFYRQAQQAIMKCLPRLKEMGVPTKRPEDYFAEMAKTDNHMQKVAKVLNKRQIATERAEKVRKVREQKKFAKQTQVHVLQERQKAKRELTENIKKYRKGQKNNLDFLDDKKGQSNSRGFNKKPMVNRKRERKDEKYGFGGKKPKWNTRESLDDYDGSGGGKKGFGSRGKFGGGGQGRPSFGRGGGRGGGGLGGSRGGMGGGRGGGGRGGSRGGMGGGRGRGGFGGSRGGMGGGRGGGNRPGKMSRQKQKARAN